MQTSLGISAAPWVMSSSRKRTVSTFNYKNVNNVNIAKQPQVEWLQSHVVSVSKSSLK